MTNKEESKNEEAHIIVDGKKKDALSGQEYYTNTRGVMLTKKIKRNTTNYTEIFTYVQRQTLT